MTDEGLSGICSILAFAIFSGHSVIDSFDSVSQSFTALSDMVNTSHMGLLKFNNSVYKISSSFAPFSVQPSLWLVITVLGCTMQTEHFHCCGVS